MSSSTNSLPPLPYEEWKDTRDTLHMLTQMVGKLRLQLSPPEQQWGHVPLYVTTRGLTTSPMPYGDRTFAIDFDFHDHELTVSDSRGAVRSIALSPKPVAQTYAEFTKVLEAVGINIKPSLRPSEVSNPIPFNEDALHSSYHRAQVQRFFRAVTQIDMILKEHRTQFKGRTSLVGFYWGTFDLSYSR